MATRGIAYIAFGDRARAEMLESVTTLRRHHKWPLTMAPANKARTNMQKSRLAKVTLLDWSPYENTLYLDADTRIRGYLDAGFRILDDGWDMAMVPSANQGKDWLWHVGEEERQETYSYYKFQPVQLQAGMMFVRRNDVTEAFFRRWAYEWKWYADQDQGALLRALRESPVKIFLLGRPWNGGALVNHLFGRTR